MASQFCPDEDAIHGINMTPLVDIMLVLLIIFMVAARLEGPSTGRPSSVIVAPSAHCLLN